MAQTVCETNGVFRVGSKAEMYEAKSGLLIGNLSVVFNSNYRMVNGVLESDSNWIKLVGFGKLAEKIEQVEVGDLVHASGPMKLETYVNRKGEEVTKVVITVNTFNKIASSNKSESESNSRPKKISVGARR